MTGKLLDRHGGSAMAPLPASVDNSGDINKSMFDPLSSDFIVPPDIRPTPWGLAQFFVRALNKHYGEDGRMWKSLFSCNAYMKPAKLLLDEVGFEEAVRTIVYAVSVANHCPSFAFVLRCSERFKPCPETGSLT